MFRPCQDIAKLEILKTIQIVTTTKLRLKNDSSKHYTQECIYVIQQIQMEARMDRLKQIAIVVWKTSQLA